MTVCAEIGIIFTEFASALGETSLEPNEEGYVALASASLDITLVIGLESLCNQVYATIECDFLAAHSVDHTQLNELLSTLWQYMGPGLVVNQNSRYLIREKAVLDSEHPSLNLVERTESLVQLAIQLRQALNAAPQSSLETISSPQLQGFVFG